MENLLQCKGKKFKANINDLPAEGRIQVEEGSIYLCQDARSGSSCEDKLGFKYSWCIGDGSEVALIKTAFQIFVSALRRKKRPNLSRIGR